MRRAREGSRELCERPGKRLPQLAMIAYGDGYCGGRSGVSRMSSELASESRVPEDASFALCKAGFVLPSASATALRSGAKDTRERDVPGASRASIDEGDAGGEDTLSDQVTIESEENSRPVESMLPKALAG